MKKIVLTFIGALVAVAAMAQEITPYTAYQIKQNIQIDILEVERVEKYGWDNLEFKYKLSNNSEFDLEKYDFMIHLVDKNGHEIGTIDAYAFNVGKKSITEGTFIQAKSEYSNAPIDQLLAETNQIAVVIEDTNEVICIAGSDISAAK